MLQVRTPASDATAASAEAAATDRGAPAAPRPSADTAADPIVRFEKVEKTYDGRANVVQSLDLDIVEGEFLTLLGPSGSGKTTTLMMLAGFEEPTAGDIRLRGRSLTRLPPF